MIKIRYSRLKRFGKNNKKIKIAFQILAIWYLTMFSVGYLSSDTGAYFNSSSQMSGTITAGTWQEQWDNSSLQFPNKDTDQLIIACDSVEISVAIYNDGREMKGQTQFELFYNENKNPKDGRKIGEGNIEPLKSGELGFIKFAVNKPGNYKFKAYQRPGHANNYETRQELWSETVTVKCETLTKTQNEVNTKSTSQTEVIIPVNKSIDSTKNNTQKSSNEGTIENTPPLSNE